MKKTVVILMVLYYLSTFLCSAQSHKLFGMTQRGGTNGIGTIFKINEDSSGFQVVYSFDSLTGYSPLGTFIQATNGKLYGVTEYGGLYNNGVLFSFDPVTYSYINLHNFNYDSIDGYYPWAGVIQASNGRLYGTCIAGGTYGFGIIFSYDISLNNYSILHNFNTPTGSDPSYSGRLFQGINGKLYGMTEFGGITSEGEIFSFDITNNTYDTLFNFNSFNNNGYNPIGGIIQANNGKLYGMTSIGGQANRGTLFSYDLSATSFTDLYYFGYQNITSSHSWSTLLQASDGLLYGNNGDGQIYGVLFSFNPDSNILTARHFYDGNNGRSPINNSLIQGSGGMIYGMTHIGGNTNSGVIFSFDPVTNIYSVMHHFDGINGKKPEGDLVEVSFTTSIDEKVNENKQSSINISPNPASAILNIHHSTCTSQETLLITDLLGTEVYKETLTGIDNTISISTWSAGIYFYEVRGEKESIRGKFVVQK